MLEADQLAHKQAVLLELLEHQELEALEGLEVHHGDVLEEEAAMELPMEQVSWVMAATDDDAYNALVCLRFGPELGREHCLQLAPTVTKGAKEAAAHMKGRAAWGERATAREITGRFWRGGSFKTTAISGSYSFEDLKEQNRGALFLFYVLGKLVFGGKAYATLRTREG